MNIVSLNKNKIKRYSIRIVRARFLKWDSHEPLFHMKNIISKNEKGKKKN